VQEEALQGKAQEVPEEGEAAACLAAKRFRAEIAALDEKQHLFMRPL
jgi:hypothetical protein